LSSFARQIGIVHALTNLGLHPGDVEHLGDGPTVPSVDYRSPAGLSWDELLGGLQPALRSGPALGAEVTIFNPLLDPDHSVRRCLVAELASTHTPRLRLPVGAAVLRRVGLVLRGRSG
jgi:hypothetical protein